ncbi:hypothetical protein ACWD5R_41060 [Streptomyces sp. NPDC002514]|uniref:hypothetical protein n=1 Tax=Streptomyces sp. NPDC001270 TaxID=3364554 RepID=UPI0036AC7EAD
MTDRRALPEETTAAVIHAASAELATALHTAGLRRTLFSADPRCRRCNAPHEVVLGWMSIDQTERLAVLVERGNQLSP